MARNLVATGIAAVFLVGAAGAGQIALVDDLGAPLTTAIETCAQVELQWRCSQVISDSVASLPPGFVSLRIEGPDYGPLMVSARDIAQLQAGSKPLYVSRKATVQLAGGSRPETVTLYAIDEPELRRPAQQVRFGAAAVKVAAGEFVASLGKPGYAPQLLRLSLEPGTAHTLRFEARPGWSLALRVLDPQGQALDGAAVEVRPMAGYGSDQTATRRAKADALGFVLLSGLPHPLVEATVHHPEYLMTHAPGLVSAPSTFAFRSITMHKGGLVRAAINVDGKSVPGAACRLLRFTPPPIGSPIEETVHEGRANASGICVTAPLPAGNYVLEVAAPREGARAQFGVELAEGQDTEVTADLVPVHLFGTVRRGKEGAAGYEVQLYSNSARVPGRTARHAAAASTVEEDGEYRATVWAPGDYSVVAMTPTGTPAASRRLELAAGENVLDLELDSAGISGVVVDQAGAPLENVGVVLRVTSGSGIGSRVGKTAANGTFHFPMAESAHTHLEAFLRGYRSPAPAEVSFVAGQEPPAVRLELVKEKTLRGALRTATGVPVARGWVALFSLAGSTSRLAGAVQTDEGGIFELPAPADGVVRGFAGGSGCPLTLFAPAATDEELLVTCPATPAALQFRIRDEHDAPVSGSRLLLAHEGLPIPWEALALHQSALGLPPMSDAAGQLTLVALAPGQYRAYLLDATTEQLVWSGSDQGFVGAFALPALALTEVEVRIERGRLPTVVVEPPPG